MNQENNHMYSSKRGINLKKAVKYLYRGNYETLMKETDTDKWEDVLCSWIGRIKISILLKSTNSVSSLPKFC